MGSEDFKWFIENYQELYAKYGMSYLIIHNKEIVDANSNAKKALLQAQKMFPSGDFIIQYCNGNETGYTNFISNSQISVI